MTSDPTPPADDTPEPEATQPTPPNPKAEVTPTRRMLWAVGGGLGVYMIGRGIYGVLTKDDQQP